MRIEGYDLPGRSFCGPNGEPYSDVRVGIQIRKNAEQLVPGDADTARWDLDIAAAKLPDGGLEFRGPAVHGKRGDRFVYLTWGNLDSAGHFHMFRRAKLMLNRIDPGLVHAANDGTHQLVGRVRLSDDHGTPRCARVDPPDLTWAVATT